MRPANKIRKAPKQIVLNNSNFSVFANIYFSVVLILLGASLTFSRFQTRSYFIFGVILVHARSAAVFQDHLNILPIMT